MIVLGGGRRAVDSLTFCPTGPLLAVVAGDQPIAFWDYAGGAVARRWDEPFDDRFRHWDSRYHPHARVVRPVPGTDWVSGPVRGGHLRLFHPPTGDVGHVGDLVDPNGLVRFAPDGDWLVYGRRDNALVRAAVDDRRLRSVWRFTAFAADVAVLPDGRCWVSLERVYDRPDYRSPPRHRGRLAVRAAADGRQLAEAVVPAAAVRELAVDPAGETAVVRTDAGLFVWPVGHLRRDPTRLVTASRDRFTGLAFSPSGRYLAATGDGPTVRLYDTATWRPVRSFDWGVGRLTAVAFGPDGTVAAVGTAAGQVVVWDFDG